MELLEKLVNTPGVPGRESMIRSVIEDHVTASGIFDDIQTDVLGSLICVRYARPQAIVQPDRTPKKVLVAAHMDQIGFLVSSIAEGGYLYLHPVGAFDTRTLFSRRVIVCTEDGHRLPGVLNPEGRPIHTAPPEELKKVPEIDNFFVDLALPEPVVREQVRQGDMVVFCNPLEEIGDSVIGPGLDNRVGCWALIRAMESLQHHQCDIYAVWTAQEEVGSRGAQPVSFGITADIGISCDTTVSCELPGISNKHHITHAGEGVSIQIADSSTLADMSLVHDIEDVARQHRIKCQRSLMLGGGQDGARIQLSRTGVRTIVLSCPIKYIHTATEMAHRNDLSSYKNLLVRYLESL